MKKLLAVLVVFLVVGFAMGQGVSLTVENDALQPKGSDNNYTQSAELEYFWNAPLKARFAGLRSWFYTPNDISIVTNQPLDRPYCGVGTLFYEQANQFGSSVEKLGIEVGVQGPSALGEEEQTWFHDLIGDETPMGWDNQLADEPVLNVYADMRANWVDVGRVGKWEAKMDGLYGGVAGTEFINVYGGVGVAAGWNVPPVLPSGINPKAVSGGFPVSACVLADLRGIGVIHNATLADSFFHPDQTDLDLNMYVGELRYGARIGCRWLALSYMLGVRTEEFETQEGMMDWGMIKIEAGRMF